MYFQTQKQHYNRADPGRLSRQSFASFGNKPLVEGDLHFKLETFLVPWAHNIGLTTQR
jgi:hypothetical protein